MPVGGFQRIHIRVHGGVQGVGFRAYTRRQAQRLGIAGWVRNERDGSVEILAEGDNFLLTQFLAEVRNGPPGGFVDEVLILAEDSIAQTEFSGFIIAF
jgi:acylphosphatase